MNKKIVKTIGILLLLTAVTVSQVPASDVEADNSTSDFQMDGSTLIRYSGTAEVVSVPDEVLSIGEEAFAGNDHVVKVTVDGKVKSIGYGAFSSCDNLRTVIVGDHVEEIDTAAFSNNPSLVHVSLGAGVRKLGSGVFAGCENLSDLTVSEDNTMFFMESDLLYGKDHEKIYVMLPTSNREELEISNDVQEIIGYAFWGNQSLKRVSLGSGLYEVPAFAFSNCMNLIEVNIPLPVRSIGAKAFEDCVSLKSISIPESVTRIHDTSFDGCPQVTIHATAGTYGADYAQELRKTKVEEIEYEDVQNAQLIAEDEVQQIQDASTVLEDEITEDLPAPSPEPMTEETENTQNKILLGESSIVTNRALIFIDNRKANVRQGNSTYTGVDLSGIASEMAETDRDRTKTNTENLLADDAEKGKGFPKYTVVADKIASQAYYQDIDLTSYEFPEGITEIGEFAFARSGLTSITIPDGVTRIGYGAFYHCDQLQEVHIPDSVTEISEYAFSKTPFATQKNYATGDFLIAGDGVLFGYLGGDSVVNIPNGVKTIGDGVFRDHMGITAVNIPDSVTVIGEEAFRDCKNLATVNGGKNLITIQAGAFQGCPLSNVTIPDSVTEIGIAAFDLAGGTDTVTFLGIEFPQLIMGHAASRINHVEERTYAFGNISKAIVPEGAEKWEGTILEDGIYGFCGTIYDEQNKVLQQNQGVSLIVDDENKITIDGSQQSFYVQIEESEEAAEKITVAYAELYGGREPAHLQAYNITLLDESGTVPITKLGKQYATVKIKTTDDFSADNLHVVSLDQDGQMEALSYEIVESDQSTYVVFSTNHFSPFGFYSYEDIGGTGTVQNGKAMIWGTGTKDATPDTGDFLHPKWFFVIGCIALAIVCFFYKGKSGASGIT